MAILSKDYLERLIREGKASYSGGKSAEESIINHDDKQYVAVDRHDKQRVDHYEC